MIKSGILFEKTGEDDDSVELKITISNEQLTFSNLVYVGRDAISDLIKGLDKFKTQLNGGIFNCQFGEFGPEYANGAFYARLHFQDRGLFNITIKAQGGFELFGKEKVANKVTLYLISEVVLLDNFIYQLIALNDGRATEAGLEARL
jgi:hypothetical protein